ncbi:serine/threonine-protein kinase [Paractinoplanes lichenicola]|uniref:Serine/threonine protein kinase n=1 Tax=Paractinoplanes lichenicola TaxID=2802976 RepID=A0ABS1VEC6_9ACTN|nr:serine/threonine-protein kinase [Actinoplanes lichenicola]MBL7253045.1 serine/threonine protein kinase [Actinoplanes lichenicola]
MTDPLLPGDPAELGGYRLLGRLGQGGMGAVYLGERADGRLVAVKMIRPELAPDTEFRARFRSEVNRARQVPPFCTAEVLDADPDHPTPYLVVEYVDGPSLSEVIARGPLSGGSLHSVAVGVATALAAIHGAAVIHRDLKPSNVLLPPGTPKVIDFGIARAFEATSKHTRTDQMVGTVAYMAPESIDNEHFGEVGPAADVFAWGAVVTYAATGRTPFRADSPTATAARILTQPPDLTGVPEPLKSVVARALAKNPAERPTAPELLQLLLDLDTSDKTELIRPEVLKAAAAARRKRRRRLPRRALVAGAAALVLAAAGLYIADAPDGTSRAATPEPAVSAPAWQRNEGGPALVDGLDRPGQWQESLYEAEGRCVFDNERFEASTGMASIFACPGPADSFAKDQAVRVGAAILTSGSCAEIWFRKSGTNAALVSLCESEVRLGIDTKDGVIGEEQADVPEAELGDVRQVEIVVRGSQATVSVDGAARLTKQFGKALPSAGRVTFGALDDIIGGDARAAFTGASVVSIASPSPSATSTGPRPRFADLTRGSVRSVVKLHSYDVKNASAVVEPMLFMTGEAYCRTFKVPPTDGRCIHEAYVTEDSRTKAAVPIAPNAEYFTWEAADGQPTFEAPEEGGTVPMSAKQFAEWAAANKQAMVAVNTQDGVITRMAVVYTP